MLQASASTRYQQDINKISVGAITNKGTDIHFAGSQALIVRKDII
jgi:hypothetical protein